MKSLGWIFLACALWASDTLIRYPLMGELSAAKIVLTEHFLLTLIFIPLLWRSKEKFAKANILHVFCFVMIGGFGSALGTLAFTNAFRFVNPSLVILLQKLQPLVAIVFAHLVLKEKMTKAYLSWAAICLFGAALISYQDLESGFKALSAGSIMGEKAFIGYGLALIAVFSWGSAGSFGKKLSRLGYETIEIMGGRFVTGFLFMVPFLATENIFEGFTVVSFSKITLMILLSGVLGMYFYYRGLKKLPAKLCALAELSFPFFAVSFNWIYLGAELTVLQILGAVILLIGSTVIQLRHY